MSGFYLWNTKWYRECGIKDVDSLVCQKKNYFNFYTLNKLLNVVMGPFSNYRLGCLLLRYGPKVLGRRIRTGLTTTHPKLACAQTRAPLLKFWSLAHGRGNYYKRVMAGKYNITTTKGNMPTVNHKTC